MLPDTDNRDKNENTVFILKYIQEHYTTVSLPELAAFFNYSERQIQRIVKSSTGLSLSENIRKLKMRRASWLLQNTGIPIADISDELCYNSPVNFRHVFKEYFGMAPSEYRKNTGKTD